MKLQAPAKRSSAGSSRSTKGDLVGLAAVRGKTFPVRGLPGTFSQLASGGMTSRGLGTAGRLVVATSLRSVDCNSCIFNAPSRDL